MGYSKNPFGRNRSTNKSTKSLLNLGFGIISGISKANKAAKKENEKQKKASEKRLIAQEKARIREEKAKVKSDLRETNLQLKEKQQALKEEEKRKSIEKESWYILNGYIKKPISFFTKYIALSIIDDTLKLEIEHNLKEGKKHIFIHNDILEELKNKHKMLNQKEKRKIDNTDITNNWHNGHPGINTDEDLPDYI